MLVVHFEIQKRRVVLAWLKSIVFSYVFKKNAGSFPDKSTRNTSAASAYPPECNVSYIYFIYMMGTPLTKLEEILGNLLATRATAATRTSENIWINEQKQSPARAFYILVHFVAFLRKTTT